ncbi:type IV pilus twitching motility protein PilT [Patescibacteria group bacterium]|nr:type IV pilus twitching motility protein PilT [Patescibacteria group bacterium]
MASSYKTKIESYLEVVLSQGASDLHITVGKPPSIRVDARLFPIEGEVELDEKGTEGLIKALLDEEQLAKYIKNRQLDFSYSYQDKARFRVNVFFQKGTYAAALRLIPKKIFTLEELGLPETVAEFTDHSQGFVLIVGPTGHGKTTTLVSLVNLINKTREEHIITIEDPIEYTFPHEKCMVAQREIYDDAHSFADALKASLREDPDVVLVGEMRDLETISSALTIAETGHLVFSTLHTNDAAQTIDRIIDVFPPHQQNQIKIQLAGSLLGIVSQRLVPRIGGGRVPVVEVLKVNSAVKNLIREGKTHQINNIIQTGAEEGMIPLNKSLAELVQNEIVTEEDAFAYTNNQRDLKSLL